LPQTLTRWLILQKARRQGSKPLRPVVSIRFQILFHSPRRGSFHLSLTVLLHYRSSSVFSLGQWTAQLPTELACSVVLRIPSPLSTCVYGTITRSGRPSQIVPLQLPVILQGPTTPNDVSSGLGYSAFARHYSRNLLFSSGYLDVSVHPVPLPCGMPQFDPRRVSPFGHLWLLAVAHTLPELFAVYRVLLRHLTPRHPPYALIHFST
jgi:hypothetical protein